MLQIAVSIGMRRSYNIHMGVHVGIRYTKMAEAGVVGVGNGIPGIGRITRRTLRVLLGLHLQAALHFIIVPPLNL